MSRILTAGETGPPILICLVEFPNDMIQPSDEIPEYKLHKLTTNPVEIPVVVQKQSKKDGIELEPFVLHDTDCVIMAHSLLIRTTGGERIIDIRDCHDAGKAMYLEASQSLAGYFLFSSLRQQLFFHTLLSAQEASAQVSV